MSEHARVSQEIDQMLVWSVDAATAARAAETVTRMVADPDERAVVLAMLGLAADR